MIVDDASLAQVAAVLARRLDTELPDVQVEEVPTRQYPADAFAAHLFGYVGEASEGQVESEGLSSGAIVGQAGIEKVYNKLLMGEDGARAWSVNSMGREIRDARRNSGDRGRAACSSPSTYDLQQRGGGRRSRRAGSTARRSCMDPRTGEVLAFTSRPAYDPNDFAAGIDRATWAALNTDRLKPLQNRAIQGRYSPGSTFKIVVAVGRRLKRDHHAGLPRVVRRRRELLRPVLPVLEGGRARIVDLRHAIEQSCNMYFYTVGNMLGVDRMHKWATLLGLGEKTGIDLPNEVEGLVPSTEWKRRRYNEKWYAGETISVSIGQGQVSITPISLAVMMSTVANGGTRCHAATVEGGRRWQRMDARSRHRRRSRACS